eukprot:TRINITY_DN57611_c0_g1_i1.p1 TRINITY_DN57611_c0_g1~~TRINITY_DN57611_c0_g1_i1.p1  ORF type:complete len:292 (+),score=58.30 TRINITY_DN57611_c0_g1_i1:1-876(+)
MRLLRLARLARLIRALRYKVFLELKLMVMGVFAGMRGLLWGFVLLMSIIYFFALVFKKTVGAEEPEFSTVIASMSTLFRCFTEGCSDYEGFPLQERLRQKYSWGFFVAYLSMYILVGVGVFNTIMALFIDNVMNSQAERKQQDLSMSASKIEIELKECLCRLLLMSRTNVVPEEVEQEIRALQRTMDDLASRVRAQFECLIAAGCHISKDAFDVWLEDAHFLDVLDRADISIHNKAVLFEVMDADMSLSLSADEVFHGLMNLRGPVTKGDVIYMSMRIRHLVKNLHDGHSE